MFSAIIHLAQAITAQAEDIAGEQQRQSEAVGQTVASDVQQHSALVDANIVAAMKSVVGQFNDRGVTSHNYEEFLREI